MTKTTLVFTYGVPGGDKYSDKPLRLSKILKEQCPKKNIPLINHNNINQKRH